MFEDFETGDKLTVLKEIVNSSGRILLKEGQKVTITDFKFKTGYFSRSLNLWIPDEYLSVKIKEAEGDWFIDTFKETSKEISKEKLKKSKKEK